MFISATHSLNCHSFLEYKKINLENKSNKVITKKDKKVCQVVKKCDGQKKVYYE